MQAISMAPAPEGAPNQEGHATVMILFYIALFAVFYFLLIRPQTQKNQEVKTLQSSLEKGARVVTTGGIFGTIHKIDDEVVTLEIAEGVRVKIQKAAIEERVGDPSPASGKKKKEGNKA